LSGGNEVFAISGSSSCGDIYVNSANAKGQWSLVDRSPFFESLSAAPNNTLFATDITGQLFEETETLQFIGEHRIGRIMYPIYRDVWQGQNISSGKTWWATISADLDASGKAEVYAIADTGLNAPEGVGPAYLYDQGILTSKDSTVADISGANGGYFYVVNYNARDFKLGGDYQFSPSAGWTFLASGFE